MAARATGSTAARPRLLILTPDYPPAPGGIQLVSERLAAGIERLQTRVLTLQAPGGAEFDGARSGAVHRVSAARLPHAGRLAVLNASAVGEALRFRPHVTLSMHIVVSPAAVAIKRALGVPFVQYFHAEEIGARPRLAAFAALQASEGIAVSAYTAGLVRATGAAEAALTVIPNGVEVPVAPPPPPSPEGEGEPTPAPEDRPTFVTVARIQERYKGHDVLVRALALVRAKVPRVQWVVIGEGSLRPGIEAQARSYGVASAARFLGTVSDERRDAWLRRADLLAMPSRLPAGGFAGEGFGIVYLEAGAHGKPVVAGNVGGALDAVLDGVTGMLVDPLDELAVGEAIAALLLDPVCARRLGAAGRVRAQEHAWPLIVERVQELLLAQLAPPGHGQEGGHGEPGAARDAA
jgi:phosphatidylinositol alpha-1,6-mannosyltransferase